MASDVAQRERSNIKCHVSAFNNILMSSHLHVFLLPQGLQKFVPFHHHLVRVAAEESEETSCKFS